MRMGKSECIHPWLKINKSDAEKVEAYEDAILARKHLSVIDLNGQIQSSSQMKSERIYSMW